MPQLKKSNELKLGLSAGATCLGGYSPLQTNISLSRETAIVGSKKMNFFPAFGGAPCPSEWGSIAKSICDLANAILLNNKWDHFSLQSPAQYLVPNKITLEDDTPFGIGRDLIVNIPVNSRGTVDLYIDNFCGLMVDIDDNATRLERAPLLALVSAA